MALPNYLADSYTQRQWSGMGRGQRRRAKRGYQPPAQEDDGGIQVPVYTPQPIQPTTDFQNHPFFDPSQSYITNPNKTQALTPGSLPYYNYATTQSPEGYYYGILNERGLGGTDARSTAAQSMFRDYARGYQAAKLKNQELWFPQYMEGQDPNAMLDSLSNEAIGIDDRRFQGRDRWGMRGY